MIKTANKYDSIISHKMKLMFVMSVVYKDIICRICYMQNVDGYLTFNFTSI